MGIMPPWEDGGIFLARLRAALRRDRSRGWRWGFGLGGAGVDQPHNRAWARRKTAAPGQLEAIATRMRRTLRVTRAPIFRSFRRIVPQVAAANSVPAKPMRRSAVTST